MVITEIDISEPKYRKYYIEKLYYEFDADNRYALRKTIDKITPYDSKFFLKNVRFINRDYYNNECRLESTTEEPLQHYKMGIDDTIINSHTLYGVCCKERLECVYSIIFLNEDCSKVLSLDASSFTPNADIVAVEMFENNRRPYDAIQTLRLLS